MADLDMETVGQLERMIELLDQYPQIVPNAVYEFSMWADGQKFNDDQWWNEQTRREQADKFINWLQERIADESNSR